MALGLVFFGLLLAVGGTVIHRKDLRLWRDAASVTGIVEDRVFRPGQSRPTSVIVRFTTPDGVTRQGSVGAPQGPETVDLGDPVELVYNPADLRDVRRAESHDPERRPRPNALLVLGVLFLVVAAGLVIAEL
ncbi:DUF3592 domain-containing protein [Streptomyces sp. SID13726]|uniref:DUF3592 domain-containing protein n=1 Tax=Streptomyces sp. SID13726 TaxID=2706058 RepID=UPI0013BD0ECD|nr:DUF3592 domain-containing protein [Streptomyces sp. SID13726]NEA99740.1 hypothetical protein [Streptomyces sp. SID13726]